MNTKIYEYLIAVAEQKNITKAAQQCFISQPALTQQIKKLEQQYGFLLFQREGKDLVPTGQGQVILTTARRMLQVEQEMLQQIAQLKQNPPQGYHIFIDISMRNFLIERIWPEFQSLYPDIKPKLLSGDEENAWELLNNQMADIAIFPLQGQVPANMDCFVLEKNEYLLLLPPNHPAAASFSVHGVDFSLLGQESFIRSQPFSFFHRLEETIFHYYQFSPQKELYPHSINLVPQMVKSGQGIAFFPDILLPFTPMPCSVFPLTPPRHFQYIIAYRNSRKLNAYDECLIQLFMQHYGQIHNSHKPDRT